ncbi:MAG: hypothetical protein Q617_SPSC00086G0001, partial [Streptococcus sp. DORA_10]
LLSKDKEYVDNSFSFECSKHSSTMKTEYIY